MGGGILKYAAGRGRPFRKGGAAGPGTRPGGFSGRGGIKQPDIEEDIPMETIKRPKGTADVYGADIGKWHFAESLLCEKARLFGFSEIRFPTFEYTELFRRGVGEATDVVQKEMYTFEDKGGRSLTLRPEGTASTVRAYLENSIYAQGAPFKVYYIVPNFRYEKPQSGRLREHHQFGVECFGTKEPSADAEVISVADAFIRELGIKDVVVDINSIGCKACRPGYLKALSAYFETRVHELCDTCRGRLATNPMRILDCKSPVCAGIAKGAPRAVDSLCPECRDHFERVKGYLSDMDIPFEVNPFIVRGLDYYTKTVFEFVSGAIGAQGTICGGGRYDGLVSELGGPDTPALGFGCGLERLIMAAEACGFSFPSPEGPDIFIASADPGADAEIQRLVLSLRRLGVRAERDICGKSLKAQLKTADRQNAVCAAVVGGDELSSRSVVIRHMRGKAEQTAELSAAKIRSALRQLRKAK